MSKRWFREQIARCVANPTASYWTTINGIDFCARCGHVRGLHDSIRAQMAKAKGERA